MKVDLRPLLHFWLNKPDSFDDGSHDQTARQRNGVYNPESNDWTTRKWGNSFSAIDLWIEVDSLMQSVSWISVFEYLFKQDSQDWNKWSEILPNSNLGVMLYAIIEEVSRKGG